MKKLFSIILIACLAMAMMAVAPVGAANDEVLIGTPEIDGKIDDIYKKSLTIVYDGDPSKNVSSVAEGAWWDASATFYALYDGRHVYLAAEVKDDDVVSASDIFIYENVNPYGNDVVEFRLDLGGGDPWSDEKFFKIGIDAYGKNIYSPDSLGIGCDLTAVEYATSITEDGYIIEVAIPHGTRGEFDDLLSVGKLGLKCWIFDLPAEHAGIEAPVQGVHFYHYAMSIEGEEMGDRVFYNLSDERAAAEPVVTEPVVTEPVVTEPVVTEPVVTEPVVTEPVVTEPVVTEPDVTEPDVTEPVVTEPVVTEPDVTEPDVTEPDVTEPDMTEPVVTEPVVTEPDVTEPDVTEPDVTEPEDSEDDTPSGDVPEDGTKDDDKTDDGKTGADTNTTGADGDDSGLSPLVIAAIAAGAVVIVAVIVIAVKKKH